ncbi:MAG: HAD-IA family hydrolase [Candidatus Omnitrophica bacterium]|nr:HAD-IA family hydrolase [Candidatus Omnitrophota bacterium]MBU0880685.1 HAD-IA family hydrolase [Candidatus Omnitrophota bacterium]MBU1808370.1 HAD-IA family hydrolase [Candidatus Omnitrophota bacterium]
MALFDTIFFDVDGTLVDATSDIANAMNHALRVLGLGELPKEEIVSHIGLGVKDLIRNSLGTDDQAIIEKGTRLYSDHYVAHAADETVLYPHAIDILNYLKDKRKFILTNRYAAFADVALRGLGIRDYFEEIIGGDDENCLKPMACVVDRAAGKFGIDKKTALIVGDMDVDVMTGKNAGVAVCWVTYGLGRMEDVRRLKPEYMIDDLIELKGIIK